jgi:hypothetical protein
MNRYQMQAYTNKGMIVRVINNDSWQGCKAKFRTILKAEGFEVRGIDAPSLLSA